MGKPYEGKTVSSNIWRIPEKGSFGMPGNLTEVGIGGAGRLVRRFVFDEVVSVTSDEHLLIDEKGVMWQVMPDGSKKELKGRWEKVDEPMLQSGE